MLHHGRKFHRGRKWHIEVEGRKCLQGIYCYVNINCDQCVSFNAKKNRKGQNSLVMEFNSRQLIHYLKIEIASLKWKWFECSWIYSERDGAPYLDIFSFCVTRNSSTSGLTHAQNDRSDQAFYWTQWTWPPRSENMMYVAGYLWRLLISTFDLVENMVAHKRTRESFDRKLLTCGSVTCKLQLAIASY